MSEVKKFKYNEDVYLNQIIAYIGQTYSGHYAFDEGIQGLDVWDALGSSVETCRDTAIKYLMRYGRKEGRNRKDLEKAIHYLTLMMFFEDKRNAKAKAEAQTKTTATVPPTPGNGGPTAPITPPKPAATATVPPVPIQNGATGG